MSEVNALNPGDITSTEPVQPDELTMLKQRATLMQIPFSNNIGVDALRRKIEAKMEEEPDTTDEDGNEVASTQPNPLASPTPEAPVAAQVEAPVKMLTLAQHLQNEALKLVRVRISCMDPKKADLEGEIFTVANEYICTVKSTYRSVRRPTTAITFRSASSTSCVAASS